MPCNPAALLGCSSPVCSVFYSLESPSATLYSALLRELNTKGKDARFKTAAPGKFTLPKPE